VSSARPSDQQRIFTIWKVHSEKIFTKKIHIRNFLVLKNRYNKVQATSDSDSKKFVLNLSKCVLTDSEDRLGKGLNFAVENPHSNLDMACADESFVPKLSHVLGMEFRWKIWSMLVNSKPSLPNVTKNELRPMKSLKLNKDIRILKETKKTVLLCCKTPSTNTG
jgi:hypothetical protein